MSLWSSVLSGPKLGVRNVGSLRGSKLGRVVRLGVIFMAFPEGEVKPPCGEPLSLGVKEEPGSELDL